MKKNLLFGLLALILAWFWFGGISMAEDITTLEGLLAAINAEWTEAIDLWNLEINHDTTRDLKWKTLNLNWVLSVITNWKITVSNGKINSNVTDVLKVDWGELVLWENLEVNTSSSLFWILWNWNAVVNWAKIKNTWTQYTPIYVEKWTFTLEKWDIETAAMSISVKEWEIIINWWKVESAAWSTIWLNNNLANSDLQTKISIHWWEIIGNDSYATVYWFKNTTITFDWWKIVAKNRDWIQSSYGCQVTIDDDAEVEAKSWAVFAWWNTNDDSAITINWWTFTWYIWARTNITISNWLFYNWIQTPYEWEGTISINWWKFKTDVTKYTAEWYYSIYDWEEYYEVTNEIWTPTSFYMSSNFSNAEFKVILNEAWDSIDLWKTKAYLEKTLTAEQKTASTLYQLLKSAETTDWIEVLEVEWEKLLFVNNTTENRTDVFRSSTSWKFDWNSFLPSKATEYPTDWLVYWDAIKPTWVTNVTPDKYNEIKDWETVIWYTLHTADNGWLYAPKAYTITFVDEDWTTVLHTQVVALWTTPVFDGTTPTKAADSSYTYTFKEWTPALAEVTADATYQATYTATKKSTSSSWGGGGGSSSSSTSSNKTWDNNTWAVVETWTTNTWENTPTVDPQAVAANGYTNEMNEAYEFAFKNGITTMKTIEQADMYWSLNRIAMAKMLSQYAINILNKKPDTSKKCNFWDVSRDLDKQYNDWVTLACQLGIMWVNITDFRPNDEVTRAEFGTALSRMLFGLADWTDNYYSTHLAKLKKEKIISNDDPTLKELRWYVMLMLMRSAK